MVWYEKLTLTLDFVIFRVGVFARTKPTKVFVKYLWQNLGVRSLGLSKKKVCGKKISITKVTAHPIGGVFIILETVSQKNVKTPHIG